jgi:hypothetical protein
MTDVHKDKPKMFLSSPSPEDLKPTPEEQELLRGLWDWQQRSAKSVRLVGVPRTR